MIGFSVQKNAPWKKLIIHQKLTNKSMKKNMGSADRITRIVVAIIITFLYMINAISGTFLYVFLFVVAALVLTSSMSFSPLYSFFGISTRKKSVG